MWYYISGIKLLGGDLLCMVRVWYLIFYCSFEGRFKVVFCRWVLWFGRYYGVNIKGWDKWFMGWNLYWVVVYKKIYFFFFLIVE